MRSGKETGLRIASAIRGFVGRAMTPLKQRQTSVDQMLDELERRVVELEKKAGRHASGRSRASLDLARRIEVGDEPNDAEMPTSSADTRSLAPLERQDVAEPRTAVKPGLDRLIEVLLAPVEPIRDAKGRLIGARRRLNSE